MTSLNQKLTSQETIYSAEDIFEECFSNFTPVIKRSKRLSKRKKKPNLTLTKRNTEFHNLNIAYKIEEKITNLLDSLKKSPLHFIKTEKKGILKDLTYCLRILKSSNTDKALNFKLYRLMYDFQDILIDFNSDIDFLRDELQKELQRDISRFTKKALLIKNELSERLESLEQQTRVERELAKKQIKQGLKRGKKLFRIGIKSGLSYITYLKKKQIYHDSKQISDKVEEVYSQILLNIQQAQTTGNFNSKKLKNLLIKGAVKKLKYFQLRQKFSKLKTLSFGNISYKLKNLSFKKIFYKTKKFLMKNLLLFIKMCKYGFSNFKKLILEKSLVFIKKAKDRFYDFEKSLIKNFNGISSLAINKFLEIKSFLIKNLQKTKRLSVKTFNTIKTFIIDCFEIVAEIIEEIQELTEEERETLVPILLGIPLNKFQQKYFKFKKALLLPFIEYKTYFIEDFKENSILLKNKLNKIISKSQRIQKIKNQVIKIKLELLNIKPRFENFIIDYTYDHELIKKYVEIIIGYVKRLIFVFGMYSLPLLLLTKSFYGSVLKVAKVGDPRFDSYIPKQHLDLILTDDYAGFTYIPLKFIPRFLQSVDIDFYIFIMYFTVFGTSKFPVNKELIYHGILCVAHLIIYSSSSMFISILENIRESYIAFLHGYFRIFVLSKFKFIIKDTKLNSLPDHLRIRQLISSFSDELDEYGICGYEDYISELMIKIDTRTFSYILAPISLIFIMTLLYNCCYYVIFNKRPHIPIMTKLAKRLTPNVKDNDD